MCGKKRRDFLVRRRGVGGPGNGSRLAHRWPVVVFATWAKPKREKPILTVVCCPSAQCRVPPAHWTPANGRGPADYLT